LIVEDHHALLTNYRKVLCAKEETIKAFELNRIETDKTDN